ncbi:lytic transglycosylase domain-containing protein [Rahnella victoriana]|nr:lytic transglycosylase domain-containing protein [Rahnella victoriana]
MIQSQSASEPSITDNIAQAGKGLAQSAVNVLNIPGSIVNTALDAVGVPKENQVMQVQLPDSLKPTDEYAKIGAEIGPYLIPGIGQARTAEALSSVASSGRLERGATQLAGMLAENAPGTIAASQNSGTVDAAKLAQETGLGLAGSVAGRAIINGGSKLVKAISNGADNSVATAASQSTARPASGESAIPQEEIATNYAKAAQSGDKGRIAQVVNDIRPDQNVTSAMERLNLKPDDMLEAFTSGNDAFKAVQMGLASQDESALGAVRRDSINRISARAAKIIDDAGAAEDKLVLNNKFRANFNSARNELVKQEGELFGPVNQAIPPASKVDANNTKTYLEDLADQYGGAEYLSPMEKKAFEAVSPTSDKSGPPTYARLNSIRQQVGAALNRADTPFGSVEERNLSKLYSSLSEDRNAVANAYGFGDQIKAANALTAQRKMMENRVYGLLGKDFTGDLSSKSQSALSGLSSGNSQQFRQLMRSIPDNATRKEVVATGMRDMLRKGSRSDLANNINGFVDYYGALKRNGNYKMLQSVLTKNTMRQLEDMYTIARNVKSANSYYLATGKLNSFLEKFDKPGGFLDKLATHGKMATIATVLGHVPVAGPVMNTALAAQMGAKAATQKSGANAVQEMMGSSTFKGLASAARGKPNAAAQQKIVASAESKIAKSNAWKEFYRTLPNEEKQKIARVGIIGWLSGSADDE